MKSNPAGVVERIQKELFSFRDEAYKAFNKKLVPTIDEKTMIGIRTPVLRTFAKSFFKAEPDEAQAFMSVLPHTYFEENNLHAFFVEQIRDFDLCLAKTEAFLPFIDNWETCDLFSPPVFKKHPGAVYERILVWFKSKHCYTVRYALGLLLANYLDSEFKPEMLERAAAVKSDEYYIKMMVAWYFSFALIKQYDTAIPYIQNRRLEPFTHAKAIQKAVESTRIPAETKAYLKTLK
ncbi:DNA alkylation repair protein [Treponema sp. HNW]|uniref:DNA alkylation repair protein n=1 Tax=Treponema sp. HNW TaxID=3116654 RepID=UPI003D0ED321